MRPEYVELPAGPQHPAAVRSNLGRRFFGWKPSSTSIQAASSDGGRFHLHIGVATGLLFRNSLLFFRRRVAWFLAELCRQKPASWTGLSCHRSCGLPGSWLRDTHSPLGCWKRGSAARERVARGGPSTRHGVGVMPLPAPRRSRRSDHRCLRCRLKRGSAIRRSRGWPAVRGRVRNRSSGRRGWPAYGYRPDWSTR